jgi:hypothetical protein
MRYLVVRLAVSVLTFALGIASFSLLHASRHIANSKDEQAILQMERLYIDAHVNRDTATMNYILADDFTIRTRCRTATKADRLALLENPDFAFEAINTDNVEVEVNGDSATVTGDAYIIGRRYDMEFTTPTYSFIRSYEKRDGRWLITSVEVGR